MSGISFRSNKNQDNNNMPVPQVQPRNIAFKNNDYVTNDNAGNKFVGGYNDILSIFTNIGVTNPLERAKRLGMSIDAFLRLSIDATNNKMQPEHFYNIVMLMKQYNIPFNEAHNFYFESLKNKNNQQVNQQNKTNEYIKELENNFLILMDDEAQKNNMETNKYIQVKYGKDVNALLKDLNFLKRYVDANQNILNTLLENDYAITTLEEEAKKLNVDIPQLCKIRYNKPYEEVLIDKINEYRQGVITQPEQPETPQQPCQCTCEGVNEENNAPIVIENVDINQAKCNTEFEKPVFGSLTKNGIKEGISFGQDVDKKTRKTYGNTETKVNINNDNKIGNLYN